MTLRNFLNTPQPVELTSSVSNSTQTLPVSSTTGYPNAPFTLSIDRGTPTEELCLCTAKGATDFTVVRGYDGTGAVAHGSGAVIEHSVAAIDYREANAHTNDSTLHITPCTSGARPGSPTLNQRIYEIDTGLEYVWNGAAWIGVVPSAHTHPAGAHTHADYLPLVGGTMTGPITLPNASPGADNVAARKKYVDDTVAAAVAGIPGGGGSAKGVLIGHKEVTFPSWSTSPGGWQYLGNSDTTYGVSVQKASATSLLLVVWTLSMFYNGNQGMIPNGGVHFMRCRTTSNTTRTFGNKPFYWNIGQVHMPISGSFKATQAEPAGTVGVALQIDTTQVTNVLSVDGGDQLNIDVWEILT